MTSRLAFTFARRAPTSALRPARRTYVTSPPSHPPGTRPRRSVLASLLGATILAGGSYALGSIYPPSVMTLLYPRPIEAFPEAHTPAALAHAAQLEQQLHALPPLLAHRARPDAAEWYECRPYQNVAQERLRHSLTSGALRGPGRLALPPLVRARRDESEMDVFMHLGPGLCGHEGIIHGGMLATIVDEAMGRLAILNMPEKVAVTAKLSIDYRAPTRADQFVRIRTRIAEKNGRKMKVLATIEAMDGSVLCEADSLFVQPRYAKLMDTSALIQAMGVPPDEVPKVPVSSPLSGKEAAP